MKAVSICSLMCRCFERLGVTLLQLTQWDRVLFSLVFLCFRAVLYHAVVGLNDVEEKSQTNLILNRIQKFTNVYVGNLQVSWSSRVTYLSVLPHRQATSCSAGKKWRSSTGTSGFRGEKNHYCRLSSLFIFLHNFFFLIIFFSFSS